MEVVSHWPERSAEDAAPPYPQGIAGGRLKFLRTVHRGGAEVASPFDR